MIRHTKTLLCVLRAPVGMVLRKRGLPCLAHSLDKKYSRSNECRQEAARNRRQSLYFASLFAHAADANTVLLVPLRDSTMWSDATPIHGYTAKHDTRGASKPGKRTNST